MKNVCKKLLVIPGLLTILGITALAGYDYQEYDVTVPKFNGSGYTTYEEKVNYSDGALQIYTVGDDYTVDLRMESPYTRCYWVTNIGDDVYCTLPNNKGIGAGSSARVEFSNDLLAPVNVEVWGEWRSDT